MKAVDGVVRWCGLDLGWVYSELLVGINRRTQSLHHAYDVLHDALLRYAVAASREQIVQPHAYLRTVVGSVLANHYHDARRYVPLCLPDGNDTAFPAGAGNPPAATYPSEEHLADIRERLQAIQRILDNLPPRCGEVFWLFRVEGYTQPEIASRLGISLNMVERHVMRALIDLRAARELLSG